MHILIMSKCIDVYYLRWKGRFDIRFEKCAYSGTRVYIVFRMICHYYL